MEGTKQQRSRFIDGRIDVTRSFESLRAADVPVTPEDASAAVDTHGQ